MNGSQHICFTDSAGKALFSIPDNGLLCLFYGNGDRQLNILSATLLRKQKRNSFVFPKSRKYRKVMRSTSTTGNRPILKMGTGNPVPTM